MSAFTGLVGCRAPIQLAPMGVVGTPELAAAVCEAGGLGMLSSFGPMPLADQVAALTNLTAAPYGVGFFGFDLPHRQGDLELAASEARVVDVFWSEPDAGTVARIHDGGALAFWQVGSGAEAQAAADAGCDAVVVQGVEAGGHVRGTTPLLHLLDDVIGKIDVPVVAAGGIVTGAHVRRVMAAGASAVRIGTRFLATTESAAHPDYVASLVAAGPDDTELTGAFHVGWEDAPHRVLRSAIDAAATATDPVGALDVAGRRVPVGRWSAMPPTSSATGNVAAMALYAGAGVGEIDAVLSVAAVIELLSNVE